MTVLHHEPVRHRSERTARNPIPVHRRLSIRTSLLVFLILLVVELVYWLPSYDELGQDEPSTKTLQVESGASGESSSTQSVNSEDTWSYVSYTIVGVIYICLQAALMAVAVSWVATRRIRSLSSQVTPTRLGGIPGPFDVKGSDEIAQLGRALNEMRSRLSERDRLRTEWVSSVSHDLRTPLTALGASTEQCSALLPSLDPGETRSRLMELTRAIELEIRRVSDLSEDLLEIARLEVGAELVTEPVPIGELLSDVHQALSPIAGNRGLTLGLSDPTGLPMVEGDGRRLVRAIENLVSNALKYARTSAHISARVQDNTLEIAIEDDGPGMNPDRDRVIPPEAPLESRPWPTTGIGLEVAQRIIIAHGGALLFDNRSRGGTVARVLLPVDSHQDYLDLDP